MSAARARLIQSLPLPVCRPAVPPLASSTLALGARPGRPCLRQICPPHRRPVSSSSPPSPPPDDNPPAVPRHESLSRFRASLSRLGLADLQQQQQQPEEEEPIRYPSAATNKNEVGGPGAGHGWADWDVDSDILTSRRPAAGAAHGDLDPSSILLLAGVSPSLLPSDFYRIGQPGRHIGSWTASPPVDVVPRLDPDSLAPRGQYFMRFSSAAAAAQWADDASRQRVHAARLADPHLAAAYFPSPDLVGGARGFSLMPASLNQPVPLRRGRPSGSWVMTAFRRACDLRQLLRGALRSSHMAVLSLDAEGGMPVTTTSQHVRALVNADSADMNYQWEMVRVRRWARSRDGAGEGVPSGTSRFVMSFTSGEDVHRFMRWWHKRTVQIPAAGGDVEAGATAEAARPPLPVRFSIHMIYPELGRLVAAADR